MRRRHYTKLPLSEYVSLIAWGLWLLVTIALAVVGEKPSNDDLGPTYSNPYDER